MAGVYNPNFGDDPAGGLFSNANNAISGVINGINGNQPSGVMPTPVDSVEEFKVATTNQTADFNNSSGMEVSIVTKRGTNAWHGTAYEYYLDNNFSGNTWENNQSGTPVPDWHRSWFGAASGRSPHSQRHSWRKDLLLFQLPGRALALVGIITNWFPVRTCATGSCTIPPIPQPPTT